MEETAPPSGRSARGTWPTVTIGRLLLIAIVAAVLVRALFWLVTQRVWEDALITVTHARNAALGTGLTHHPGEPVTHGFTSALSVLIPLAGELASPGSGITVLRIVSLVAAAISIVFAFRIARRLAFGTWPTALVLLYLALDQNHVFYGMAGMETQVAVAVLLWSVERVMAGGGRMTGASLGLAVLARPDFVLWVIPAVADLAARLRRRVLHALAVAAAVLAPWVLFTTLYYGSPVPQTILAKSGRFVALPTDGSPLQLAEWAADAIGERVQALAVTFAPFYEDTLTVGAPIPLGISLFVSMAVWALAVLGAMRTYHIPGWRAAIAFAFAFAVYRALLLPGAYFDWYVPPHTAILILLAGAGLSSLAPLPRLDPRPFVAGALTIALAVHVPFTLGMERAIQTFIEDGVRRPMGELVASLVPPGETLATESAGYYGYYSNVLMLDYPGLVSRRALAIMNDLPPEQRGLLDFLAAADADWMVLRPGEWAGLRRVFPETAARYEVVERIEAPPGSYFIDPAGRQRIQFGGVVKDASSASMLLLRRTVDA